MGLLVVVIVATLLVLATIFSDTWAGEFRPIEGAGYLGWLVE